MTKKKLTATEKNINRTLARIGLYIERAHQEDRISVLQHALTLAEEVQKDLEHNHTIVVPIWNHTKNIHIRLVIEG